MPVRLLFIFLIVITIAFSGCSDKKDQPLQETAERFLSAVAQGDYARAHRFLATPLSQQTSVDALQNFIELTGLSDPGARSWRDARIDGDQAHLTGSIAVVGQQKDVPVRLSYLKEEAHWKITGLERGVRVTSPSGTVTLYAPADADSVLLARQTTADFAAAIKKNDLPAFWRQMAEAFKQQHASDQFAAAFSGFVRDQTNLAPAAALTPVFTRTPTVSPNGELILEGAFPTEPSRVVFEYRYVLQGGSWTNSGLTINLLPKNT